MVKSRQWYRPVAPVMTQHFAARVFDADVVSPCMSFAPAVAVLWRERLPGMVHIDGTARVQTVSAEDEPWLYELLVRVGEAMGMEVLLNTSLNVRGRPIINSLKEALELLDAEPLLNFLLIEDVLFESRS